LISAGWRSDLNAAHHLKARRRGSRTDSDVSDIVDSDVFLKRVASNTSTKDQCAGFFRRCRIGKDASDRACISPIILVRLALENESRSDARFCFESSRMPRDAKDFKSAVSRLIFASDMCRRYILF